MGGISRVNTTAVELGGGGVREGEESGRGRGKWYEWWNVTTLWEEYALGAELGGTGRDTHQCPHVLEGGGGRGKRRGRV